MFVVVAYDIADHKRRRELHEVLQNFGSPRQKSLFECELAPPEIAQLRWAIQEIIEPREDSVRCYFVCLKCDKKLPTGKVVFGSKEAVIV